MKAWELLETSGWCQGVSIRERSDRTLAYCAMAAIFESYSGHTALRNQALALLQSRVPRGGITLWNDDPSRTKEEVVALLKELDV